MQSVTVELGDRSYPILIGSGLLSHPGLLSGYIKSSRALIVTNDTIAPIYLSLIYESLSDKVVDVVILPDGEKYKSIQMVNRIFDKLLSEKHNRTTTLIALGGGVIGDMTGFAAACYQRGVNFIQIPTTLLAQVDSSVGGKTGVNHELGKNMIGAFHQPVLVVIDTDTLSTLPDREYRSGLAEVIKYGLISDSAFFEWLESNVELLISRDAHALVTAIEKSCRNKAAIVAADETETGIRALLNFGHTFGHAIESWQKYSGLLHGEAVAIGMVVASAMSVRCGLITSEEYARVVHLINKIGLPTSVPEEMTNGTFIEYMLRDKKNIDSGIRLILLAALGRGIVYPDAREEDIFAAIDRCRGHVP